MLTEYENDMQNNLNVKNQYAKICKNNTDTHKTHTTFQYGHPRL